MFAGVGLMIGVEIVTDKKAKTPGGAERDRIVELAFERGVLFLGVRPQQHSHRAAAHRDERAGRHRHGRAGGVHWAGSLDREVVGMASAWSLASLDQKGPGFRFGTEIPDIVIASPDHMFSLR